MSSPMSNQSFKEMDTFHRLKLDDVFYAGMKTRVLDHNSPLFPTTPIPLLALGFL